MLDWIYEIPLTWLALLISGLFVAITWLGIVFVKPFLRLGLRSQSGANDLVNITSAGFSLFDGLVLGLLSVAAFQNSEEVKRSTNEEASTLASLYRVAALYSEPLSSELPALLRDYTLYVVYQDWPAHLRGQALNGGMLRLQTIGQPLFEYEPKTKTQEILHAEMLQDFNQLAALRQERLAGVLTGIPGVLWYVVGIGAVIYLLLLLLLEMRFLPTSSWAASSRSSWAS